MHPEIKPIATVTETKAEGNWGLGFKSVSFSPHFLCQGFRFCIMWALRRATNPLRNQGFTVGISRTCCSKLYVLSGSEGQDNILESPQATSGLKRGCWTTGVQSKLFTGICSLSTQAGTTSAVKEDGYFELGASADAIEESKGDGENENELYFELDQSDEDGGFEEQCENEVELSSVESDTRNKGRMFDTALLDAIITNPPSSLKSVLDKWFAGGKELVHKEMSILKNQLRLRRMCFKALQLSDWLLANKQFDFTEKDYSSHIYLIAKVHGFPTAEKFIEKIPESFRGEMIYRTLLASSVQLNNMKKAEEVLKKMKDLGFPVTTFVCNQLLILYKMFNKKKIPEVLLSMERENIRPDRFTYQILIDIKGKSKDISGMEQIVEKMKAEGFPLYRKTKLNLARIYTYCWAREKAEAALKELEGGDLKENRWACRYLLTLYGKLGKDEEVRRVWKACEPNPRQCEYLSAIEAWGQCEKVEEAKAVFNEMLKTCKDARSKHYLLLLGVYVKNKMMDEGKALVKQMSESGCPIGPMTWDLLVKLYVDAGEVGKADSILVKAVQKSQMKPIYRSYVTVMRGYALKGDVHNAERYFKRMIDAGHCVRHWEFDLLLQAYITAKSPAYGFTDRMKAHNVFPDRALISKLATVDQLARAAAIELVD